MRYLAIINRRTEFTYAHVLSHQPHQPGIYTLNPMLRIPPSNVFQPLIGWPFADRPFVFLLHYINKAGIRDHLLQQRGYRNFFTEPFRRLDGKTGTLSKDLVGANRIVVRL